VKPTAASARTAAATRPNPNDSISTLMLLSYGSEPE
jgi:hypothetical protein